MTTTTPTTQLVTTLDTLPRPKISLTAWAKLWLAPETARQHFAALGERFTLDVPLLPTMFWTSSPDDVRAVFQEKTRALSLGAGLRRLAPHEIVFGSRIMEWWASDDHTVVRRKIAPAFMGKALQGYEPAMEDVARSLVRDLPTGQPISFHSYMRTLAREVIMSVVFGVTEPERRARTTGRPPDRTRPPAGSARPRAAIRRVHGVARTMAPLSRARSGVGRARPGDLRRDRRSALVAGDADGVTAWPSS